MTERFDPTSNEELAARLRELADKLEKKKLATLAFVAVDTEGTLWAFGDSDPNLHPELLTELRKLQAHFEAKEKEKQALTN